MVKDWCSGPASRGAFLGPSWRRQADQLRKDRNEAIHSQWAVADTRGRWLSVDLTSRRTREIGTRYNTFPYERLDDLAQSIMTLITQLGAFQRDISKRTEQRSLPDIGEG